MYAGIFSRACTALCGQKSNRESVLAEATALKDSLVDKLTSLRSSQGGNSETSGIGQPLVLWFSVRRRNTLYDMSLAAGTHMLALVWPFATLTYTGICLQHE